MTFDQKLKRIVKQDNLYIDSTTRSPLLDHNELASEVHNGHHFSTPAPKDSNGEDVSLALQHCSVYPYSPIMTSRPCTPPPRAPTTSHIMSPIEDIWNTGNTIQLPSLSPKKKRARMTDSCSSPNSVQSQDSDSDLFMSVPYPETEIEYFDCEDGANWDDRPIDDIPDPELEGSKDSIEEDDTTQSTLETTAEKKQFSFPPTLEDAKRALKDLTNLLLPRRKKDNGLDLKKCELNRTTKERLEHVRSFLHLYIERENSTPGKAGNWAKAADDARKAAVKKPRYTRLLKEWARDFICDSQELPRVNHGGGIKSLLDDEDIAQDIKVHLQSVGKYIKAEDIVQFCGTPEMLERMGRTNSISLATARRWLIKMDYRWTKTPKGQYVDGHERDDVVQYRQQVFLPQMAEYMSRMRRWLDENGWNIPPEVTRALVIWHHDESTFFANDRRHNCWVPPGTTAKPYAKGEGASLMIAHFVSADYGWLQSPDGSESACVLFRAGKNREGYFTNDDILSQFRTAVQIVKKYFSGDDHIFVYDNATTHLKRDAGALSASKMTKGPSENFFFEVNATNEDGKPIYSRDGTILKEKRRMENATFNGVEQPLYFPDNHPTRPGQFKGMAQILMERGYNVSQKKAQCAPKFSDCPKGSINCCCRRILYNEPDFAAVESRLEAAAKKHSFKILFLPKFHCELNFIEQCWGYAKARYRLKPPSSKEEDLERNLLEAVHSVPIITMRR